jgi:hypothetical protein
MRQFIAVIFLFITFPVTAQITRSPLTTRYTGIGTYSKNFTDAFSGTTNQAALAEIKMASAGVYGERRFMLKELSSYAAAIVLPSTQGGFAIAINYFGGQNFNTSQTGIGYGRKLSDKIDIGVQFNYNIMKLAGYGSSAALNFELGTLWHVTDKFHLGVHIYNPVGGKFGKENSEKLASVYKAGAGYEASDKFFISVEMGKEEDQPININVGMQYIFAAQFFARAGVATGSGNYFFGFGLKWKTCRVDMATAWQPQLGFTPGIMLLFDFKANKEQHNE